MTFQLWNAGHTGDDTSWGSSRTVTLRRAFAAMLCGCTSALVIAGCTGDASAGAQPAASVPVGAFSEVRVYPDTFGSVAACQIAGGSIIIADRSLPGIVRLAVEDGGATVVGQVGAGPNEYRSVGYLSRAQGDSILMLDPDARRLLLLTRDGEPVGARAGTSIPLGLEFVGSDSSGGAYFTRYAPPKPDGTVDSVPVLRLGPTTDSLLPRVVLRAAEEIQQKRTGQAPTGGTRSATFSFPNPYGWRDGFVVLRDGSIAVLRVEPFHLEIWGRTGMTVRGPDIQAGHLALLPEDIVESRVPTALRNDVSLTPGKPPFNSRYVIAGGSLVLVMLNGRFADSTRWLLSLDTDGHPLRRFAVAKNERPCAVDDTSLITVVRDSLGVEQIVRRVGVQ